MALARIISRSQQCWRELALDLLARGYAVEIVSPDAIPDNFADLELRVEADAASDLTANVAVRDGEHSTSLDFVHHLKAPLEDFVRRPPKTDSAASFPAASVDFNAEQSTLGEIELPDETSPRELMPAGRAENDWPDVEEGARLITPPEQVSPPVQESRERARTGITIIFHRSRPKPKIEPKTSKRSGGWFLRTSAGFALVVALSGMLAMGIHRGESQVQSASADSQNAVVAELESSLSAPESPHAMAAVAKSQGRRGAASPASPLPASGADSKTGRPLRRVNDLTAGDSLIYRDKPTVKAGSRTRHHRSRPRHDNTVADDTVTYLDRKVPPRDRWQ